MEIAFGALEWRPQEFWSATLTEFYSAMDGWKEVNGVEEKGEGISRERNEELKRLYG